MWGKGCGGWVRGATGPKSRWLAVHCGRLGVAGKAPGSVLGVLGGVVLPKGQNCGCATRQSGGRQQPVCCGVWCCPWSRLGTSWVTLGDTSPRSPFPHLYATTADTGGGTTMKAFQRQRPPNVGITALLDENQKNTGGLHHVQRSLKVKGKCKRPKTRQVQSSRVESSSLLREKEEWAWVQGGPQCPGCVAEHLMGVDPATVKGDSSSDFRHWRDFSWSPGSYFNWQSTFQIYLTYIF